MLRMLANRGRSARADWGPKPFTSRNLGPAARERGDPAATSWGVKPDRIRSAQGRLHPGPVVEVSGMFGCFGLHMAQGGRDIHRDEPGFATAKWAIGFLMPGWA